MPLPDLPALLSLTGHELRGHAAVLGGYLKLLARDRAQLSDGHQQIVVGAERALDKVIDTLDELRDVQRWLLVDRTPPPVGRPVDLREVVRSAAAAPPDGATMVAHLPAAPVLWPGDGAALLKALVTCARAVARAHVPPVTLHASLAAAAGAATVRITRPGVPETRHVEGAPDTRRSGLGLGLVLAMVVVEAHGGVVHDLTADGEPAGMVMTLPCPSAG